VLELDRGGGCKSLRGSCLGDGVGAGWECAELDHAGPVIQIARFVVAALGDRDV
jgi:hypothetical protein